ncbi:uncharacterized protein LOC135089685 isoform X2 [Scylla paramamosain]|uniref:uncharacterized protein LOC135089685 isoform X2 n=1 Tax=Scylla paramamosain TaxID=85552 RepID=UPI003083C080
MSRVDEISSKRRRRRRRRHTTLPSPADDLQLLQTEAQKKYFEEVRAVDSSRCGHRMVCEVAARAAKGLSLLPEEIFILKVLWHQQEQQKGQGGAREEYEAATQTGYRGTSCSATYSSCPYSARQLMAVVNVISTQLQEEERR